MPRDGKLRTLFWGLGCTEGRQPCLLLSHTPHQQRGMTTSQRGRGSGADSRVGKRKCVSPPLQGRSGRRGSKSSGWGGGFRPCILTHGRSPAPAASPGWNSVCGSLSVQDFVLQLLTLTGTLTTRFAVLLATSSSQ